MSHRRQCVRQTVAVWMTCGIVVSLLPCLAAALTLLACAALPGNALAGDPGASVGVRIVQGFAGAIENHL